MHPQLHQLHHVNLSSASEFSPSPSLVFTSSKLPFPHDALDQPCFESTLPVSFPSSPTSLFSNPTDHLTARPHPHPTPTHLLPTLHTTSSKRRGLPSARGTHENATANRRHAPSPAPRRHPLSQPKKKDAKAGQPPSRRLHRASFPTAALDDTQGHRDKVPCLKATTTPTVQATIALQRDALLAFLGSFWELRGMYKVMWIRTSQVAGTLFLFSLPPTLKNITD